MHTEDSLLVGDQANYLESLYDQYCQNPESVDASVQSFFKETMQGHTSHLFNGFKVPATVQNQDNQAVLADISAIKHAISIQMLIRVHRVRGHLNANLDPLQLHERVPHPELEYSHYGFTPHDLNTEIFLDGNLGLKSATLQYVLDKLQRIYCGSIGYEFMHIQHPEQKQWLQFAIENHTPTLNKSDKVSLLTSLIAAEDFEQFLAKKFPGAKRFGLEGGESTIASLDAALKFVTANGVSEVVFGMAHRGRLNVLANILHKPLRQIFSAFQGTLTVANNDVQGSGDVKYHLGASRDRHIGDGHVHLSLTANPSHLEAVNPVVMGKVRSKQQSAGDAARITALGILIHGDAAFAGQGIVAETLMLSKLPGYKSGGTLHIIINNQIGFTTSPHLSRSSPYCSDIAKGIQAPIFHVNADDPEAVIHVTRLACKFREQFKSDVVIDLICYRRHGHNEIDEPSFTQPLMYQAIAKHKTTRQLYKDKLIQEGVLTSSEVETLDQTYNDLLTSEFEIATTTVVQDNDWLQGKWNKFKKNDPEATVLKTNITDATYDLLAQRLLNIPQHFNVHPRLERIFKEKQNNIDQGQHIDWALAESMAFGSILLEGYAVRLSGQDVGRGTFSQRHAIWHDQQTAELHTPLNNLTPNQLAFAEIIDSPLSEAAVLGFDLGYAMSDPHTLVLWEAQFGDFSNGAQVIIDQFISSSEAKWLRLSGLVMLLPHGYEGQGPEHSSARPERYLQLCAQDNMQVVNCTTPANYFHVLRRQMHMTTRKPLIVITPKSLLRHKLAVSMRDDFISTESFQCVIDDVRISNKDNVKRVVICSGKVYYDLLEMCVQNKIDDIALIRLEQYYPFPYDQLTKILKQYGQVEVVWCQEEPENMGAWTFVDRKIEQSMNTAQMRQQRPLYTGRPAAASPATGSAAQHQSEQKLLIQTALKLNTTK